MISRIVDKPFKFAMYKENILQNNLYFRRFIGRVNVDERREAQK